MKEEVNESEVETNKEESVNENESTASVKEWYYVSNNDSKGSFSIDEMKAKITSGEINGSTLVWKSSMKRLGKTREYGIKWIYFYIIIFEWLVLCWE